MVRKRVGIRVPHSPTQRMQSGVRGPQASHNFPGLRFLPSHGPDRPAHPRSVRDVLVLFRPIRGGGGIGQQTPGKQPPISGWKRSLAGTLFTREIPCAVGWFMGSGSPSKGGTPNIGMTPYTKSTWEGGRAFRSMPCPAARSSLPSPGVHCAMRGSPAATIY